ncbi:MAG: AmmeMemoRadiSam system protein B [bacterium]
MEPLSGGLQKVTLREGSNMMRRWLVMVSRAGSLLLLMAGFTRIAIAANKTVVPAAGAPAAHKPAVAAPAAAASSASAASAANRTAAGHTAAGPASASRTPAADNTADVRHPGPPGAGSGTGRYYPPDPVTLRLIVQRLLSAASGKKTQGRIFGLISPHHGYLSSGIVAAAGYKQLTSPIKTVFLLAPGHQGNFSGAFIPAMKSFRTPLGEIPVSALAARLSQQQGFIAPPKGWSGDRSIDIQLPFLQQVVKSFELVPILVGKADPAALARQILPCLTEESLIIASSDLSERYPSEKATPLDQKAIKAITSFDFKTLASSEACGKVSIAVLMEIARQKKWSAQLIDYANSGTTTRARKQVAGFASIAFVR